MAETLTFTVDTGTGTGDVVITLRPDLAPNHVARIAELAQEGFYDGVVIRGTLEVGGERSAVAFSRASAG